ncbi:MAG TPA: pyrroloquinoline quinone biosynthesis peptide chaperone PqqD [Beijerinckiaceae bacterium]
MSDALSLSDVPRLPRGVRLRFDEVRSAHVLLAPERAFDLDAVAAEVLSLVDGSRSVGDIIDALAAKYAEDRAVIEGDVVAMLSDLAKKRVLDR